VPAELAALVLPLLADERVAALAQAALDRVRHQVVGQLGDALLDPGRDPAIRRRVAELLEKCQSGRSARLLVCGLDDEHVGVRERCGQGLLALTAGAPGLGPPARAIYPVVLRELGVRGRARLEHVFALLRLVLDRDALALSFRALQSDDEALRGTALEYLENVLPERVAKALWPKLRQLGRPGLDAGKRPVRPKARRPLRQVAEELHRSMDRIEIDRRLLSKPPSG